MAAAKVRKYPGLAKSKGQQDTFLIYDDGDYVMDLLGAKLTPDDEKNPTYMDKWAVSFSIREGPEQKDGSDTEGARYTHFVQIMLEGHPSFEEWGHLGLDELVSIMNAAGIERKGDTVPDPEVFEEAGTVRVHLKRKMEQIKKGKRAGEEIEKNVASRWRAYKE